MGPCWVTMRAASAAIAPASVMSPGSATIPGVCAASSSRASARRAVATTVAPRPASSRAVAAPMPDDAPVIHTTWPASDI